MIWLIINAQHDIATGDLRFASKSLTADECNYTFPNVTVAVTVTPLVDEQR